MQSFLVQNIIKKVVFILLNAQNESKCVKMHQNVCRMNCKNVWAENYNKSALVTLEWVEIGFVHEIIKELVLIKAVCRTENRTWILGT